MGERPTRESRVICQHVDLVMDHIKQEHPDLNSLQGSSIVYLWPSGQ